MTDVLIGIDAGTSMIKSVAYTVASEPLCRSSRKNEVLSPRAGYSEQDMEDTWALTAATLRETVEKLEEDKEIVGVGVTAQGDGCWLLDEDQDPVRNAILWSDGRADGVIADWQDAGLVERFYDICGCLQFPGSSLAILEWLRRNEPAAIDRADTVFFCKDWLKYRLTGEITSDPSDMTLPYLDVEAGEYDPTVFELIDAPELESLLPPLRDPTDVVGSVTPEAAARTGLPEGTPVVSGLFDVPASMFGSGVAEPGEGASVVGTTSLNQVLMDEPQTSPQGVGFTIALGLDGRWSRTLASMIGTPNLDWILDTLDYPEEPDYAAIEAEIAELPVGSDGALYHPYLSSSGERAPFLDTRARAQFTGLSPDHTDAHLIRAVYEGVALAMRDCYEHIPDTPEEVFIAGGGAKSAFWCGMFADCVDTEIRVPDGREFGAKGAALLAATGLGYYDDVETAAAATRRIDTTHAPDPTNAAAYDELYELYTMTYETMFDVWEKRDETLAAIESLGGS